MFSRKVAADTLAELRLAPELSQKLKLGCSRVLSGDEYFGIV